MSFPRVGGQDQIKDPGNQGIQDQLRSSLRVRVRSGAQRIRANMLFNKDPTTQKTEETFIRRSHSDGEVEKNKKGDFSSNKLYASNAQIKTTGRKTNDTVFPKKSHSEGEESGASESESHTEFNGDFSPKELSQHNLLREEQEAISKVRADKVAKETKGKEKSGAEASGASVKGAGRERAKETPATKKTEEAPTVDMLRSSLRIKLRSGVQRVRVNKIFNRDSTERTANDTFIRRAQSDGEVEKSKRSDFTVDILSASSAQVKTTGRKTDDAAFKSDSEGEESGASSGESDNELKFKGDFSPKEFTQVEEQEATSKETADKVEKQAKGKEKIEGETSSSIKETEQTKEAQATKTTGETPKTKLDLIKEEIVSTEETFNNNLSYLLDIKKKYEEVKENNPAGIDKFIKDVEPQAKDILKTINLGNRERLPKEIKHLKDQIKKAPKQEKAGLIKELKERQDELKQVKKEKFDNIPVQQIFESYLETVPSMKEHSDHFLASLKKHENPAEMAEVFHELNKNNGYKDLAAGSMAYVSGMETLCGTKALSSKMKEFGAGSSAVERSLKQELASLNYKELQDRVNKDAFAEKMFEIGRDNPWILQSLMKEMFSEDETESLMKRMGENEQIAQFLEQKPPELTEEEIKQQKDEMKQKIAQSFKKEFATLNEKEIKQKLKFPESQVERKFENVASSVYQRGPRYQLFLEDLEKRMSKEKVEEQEQLAQELRNLKDTFGVKTQIGVKK